MIRIEDCEAFCEADPAQVSELACRERLTMVQAYALAHAANPCADRSPMTDAAKAASAPLIAEAA